MRQDLRWTCLLLAGIWAGEGGGAVPFAARGAACVRHAAGCVTTLPECSCRAARLPPPECLRSCEARRVVRPVDCTPSTTSARFSAESTSAAVVLKGKQRLAMAGRACLERSVDEEEAAIEIVRGKCHGNTGPTLLITTMRLRGGEPRPWEQAKVNHHPQTSNPKPWSNF